MRSASSKQIALACVAAAAFAGAAAAFEEKPFDAAAFKAAQSAGAPILIDAYASWCPVCRAQKKVLARLSQHPKYDALTLFRIDYDNQAEALQALDIHKQSTLIAFKGDRETGRSVGDTQAASLEALIATAVD